MIYALKEEGKRHGWKEMIAGIHPAAHLAMAGDAIRNPAPVDAEAERVPGQGLVPEAGAKLMDEPFQSDYGRDETWIV